MHNALRWLYILTFGWWVGPLWFLTGFALCFTIVLTPVGWKMVNSTYTVATGKFE